MSTETSKTVVTYPIVTALVEAEKILGVNRTWYPENAEQQRFLAEFFAVCRQDGLTIPEIESIASWYADQINAFLQQRGSDLCLSPFDANTFGIASVLDLPVEWIEKGQITTVDDRFRKSYPAVRLSAGLQFCRSDLHNYPIAHIATQSGDYVFMTMLDNAPKNLDLVALADSLILSSYEVDEFGSLVFPMVDLNQLVDVSWLMNMYTFHQLGPIARITQAMQQTILKLNQDGARVRSAFAGAITIKGGWSEPKPEMVINGPFLCCFLRNGLSKPLFTGHITQQDWKNPGSIH